MRFYTTPHRYYCGIDLHARRMYICVLDAQGKIVRALFAHCYARAAAGEAVQSDGAFSG